MHMLPPAGAAATEHPPMALPNRCTRKSLPRFPQSAALPVARNVDPPVRASRSQSAGRAALRTTLLAALIGGGALAAGGCEGLQGGANPEVPLWRQHPNGAMRVFIHEPLSMPERAVGENYERGRPEIDHAHKRVFVGSSDWGMYALRAQDGARLWRFETAGPVQSAPLYDAAEETLYFGSNDGALYKVGAQTGRLLWRFMTSSEVSRRPVLVNGVVYATNANDTVVALDAKSGQLRWTQHRAPAHGMEIAGHSGLLVADHRVYVGFSDGHVAAFDADTSKESWPPVDLSGEAEQTLGEVPRYLDVDTTPVLDALTVGQVIYVASYAGGVFALSADTGSRVWNNTRALGATELVLWTQPAHPASDGSGMEPARKLLLAASGTTGLWALSPTDGSEVWRRDLPEGGISEPVPVAGALLVSTTRYGLFLISPRDGGIMDGLGFSGGLAMTPAVYGERAYVVTNDGTFLGTQILPPRAQPWGASKRWGAL